MSNGRLFNFAASRGYSSGNLDSLLADVRGEGRQAAPARVESKGYDGIATTAEKRAAGGGSGSSERDRCKKGKSCGAACIYYEKDCILALPETVSTSITKVRDMLERRVAAGHITEEEAAGHMQRLLTGGAKDADPDKITLNEARAKEIINSIDRMKDKHTKNGVLDEKAFDKEWGRVVDIMTPAVAIPRDKNTPLTVKDIEGLKANEKTWKAFSDLQKEVIERKKNKDPMSPEELQSKLRPIVEPLREKITPEQLRMAVALMPQTERNYHSTAGALDTKATGGRFGPNPLGDALPIGHGPLKDQTAADAQNRLDLVTRSYMEFGGKSPFTGTFVPITRSDLEHGIAESHGGRASEQGLNYSPLKTSLNVGRGSKDHAEYFGSILNRYSFDKNGKLTPESVEKVNKANRAAAASGALKGDITSKAKAAKTANDLREITSKIDQIPEQKVRDKLYNKLVANFLTTYGGKKVAETARAGIQSHGRGEMPWYWYGDKLAGGGDAAKRIAQKATSLLESGDKAGMAKLLDTMQNASGFIKTYVNANVKPNTEIGGKPAIIAGGEKTKELGKAVMEAREQILKQIEAL
jgi:hypothetical protein